MSGTAPLVEIRDLRRVFDVSSGWLERLLNRTPRRYLRAVDGVSFAIRPGETFAIVGESGSGKSTVARMVVGLMEPTAGTVRFADEAGAASRRRIQMIFQDPYASLNPRWPIARIIAEPIRAFRIVEGEAATRARVAELLGLVGLHPDDGDKFPHQFSGGQRQRVAIARALAAEARFIVCDEPTSALDVSVQAQILNLMRDLQQQLGLTYLFISHNLAVVRYMATLVGVMYLGRLVEVSNAATLFRAPRHPYTKMLLDAVPTLAGTPREALQGEPPNPIDPPSGCSFHPRCPLVSEICRRVAPVMRDGVACHAVTGAQPHATVSATGKLGIRL